MKEIISVLLLFVGLLSFSQEQKKCAILTYGDKGVTIKTPKGWVLDCETAKANRLEAVLYREGETWRNAKTVMYINFASLELEDQKSLEELMSYDEEQFKKNYEGIQIKTIDDFKVEKYNGVVKYFGGGVYPSHEYLAYLDVNSFAIMVVVSSRSENALKEESSNFLELLNSIQVLNIKTINKK